ncbi:lyase family protein [Salinarimonas ramus]|uniref:3-carboxy-cis,cis-muconate cycloisomerase n=1 Tax=Salinarimonas ramus TaxID=690164 RepID=A0A917Q4W8_9HYPH|nr:lyase family protein [Salinarimonas ramus]GGK22558.1 3-carboxy-cis,cis-muconate cycloisomerase [Salinarimonas ramus]
MTFGALDSALTGPLFATDAMRALFADRARIADMIAVETALARAQARLGLVPGHVADAIAAISPDAFDLAALGEATALSGVPSIPFLKALRAHLPADVAARVHEGATTQDLLDTAQALALSRALALVAADCDAILAGLVALAERHARTPCAGRTYGQHATPVSFGFKAAVWAVGIAEVARELPDVRAGACVASLAGPAGTLPAFGARAPEVADAFAAEIGLAAAPIAAHTRRDGIARLGGWLARLVGALAKLAGDVAHLASTEVGEVGEPHLPGRGGSSAMPHKRNPVACTVILAAASASRGHASTLIESMVAAHERPAGAWHAEWHALPALLGLASGALAQARLLAEGLVVDEAAMARNLDATRGLLFADAAAAALVPHLGAEAAHRLVAEAADAVRAGAASLEDALGERCDGQARAALTGAFDLAPYLDAAASFVPRASAAASAARAALPVG